MGNKGSLYMSKEKPIKRRVNHEGYKYNAHGFFSEEQKKLTGSWIANTIDGGQIEVTQISRGEVMSEAGVPRILAKKFFYDLRYLGLLEPGSKAPKAKILTHKERYKISNDSNSINRMGGSRYKRNKIYACYGWTSTIESKNTIPALLFSKFNKDGTASTVFLCEVKVVIKRSNPQPFTWTKDLRFVGEIVELSDDPSKDPLYQTSLFNESNYASSQNTENKSEDFPKELKIFWAVIMVLIAIAVILVPIVNT